jgi:hypothetical protein
MEDATVDRSKLHPQSIGLIVVVLIFTEVTP